MKKSTRLFDDHFHLTVEDIAKKVDQYIEENREFLKDENEMIRWASLPSVLLDNEENDQVFIQLVCYIDEMFLEIPDKISLISTAASLLTEAKISLKNYDINSLYLLVDYFRDIDVGLYQTQKKVLTDPQLLEAIRYNVLDVDKRVALLKYIWTVVEKNHLDLDDTKKIEKFTKRVIAVLHDKSADEILGIENYMNGKKNKQIVFVDSLNG